MTTEEQSGPGRSFLLTLGVVGILVGVLVAAELVVPLQPGLSNNVAPPSTGSQVIIPLGTGSNLKLSYLPAKAVVFLGKNSTVTFVNDDTVVHTVTADGGAFDSGDMKPGGSWTYNFTTPGNYSYACKYHSWMKGTITVEAGGAAGVQVVIPAGTGSNLQLTYSPASITVVIGVNNTVTWVNEDGVLHTVTATGGSFDSGTMAAGASWSHTFTTPGTYSYVCTFHSWMKGTITVKART